MRDLCLSEELLLLLTGEKGERLSWNQDVLLTGAAMAEFILAGHLAAEGEGRKAKLVQRSRPETMSPFHAAVWKAMERRGFGAGPAALLTRGTSKKHTDLLRRGLVGEGVLEEEKRGLLFWTASRFPLADPSVREEIIADLKRAAEKGAGAVEEGAALLIAMITLGGAAAAVFGREFLNDNRDRIKAVAEDAGEAVGAAKQAIEAINEALVVVVAAAGSVGASP